MIPRARLERLARVSARKGAIINGLRWSVEMENRAGCAPEVCSGQVTSRLTSPRTRGFSGFPPDESIRLPAPDKRALPCPRRCPKGLLPPSGGIARRNGGSAPHIRRADGPDSTPPPPGPLGCRSARRSRSRTPHRGTGASPRVLTPGSTRAVTPPPGGRSAGVGPRGNDADAVPARGPELARPRGAVGSPAWLSSVAGRGPCSSFGWGPWSGEVWPWPHWSAAPSPAQSSGVCCAWRTDPHPSTAAPRLARTGDAARHPPGRERGDDMIVFAFACAIAAARICLA